MSDIQSKGEREELRRLVGERARLAKAGIESRQAGLLADVEEQLAATYSLDDDVWAEATAAARKAVRDADKVIAQRCEELGIRPEFRPSISVSWYSRGENGMQKRRAELRKVAQTRIAAEGRKAKLVIDTAALERREALAAGALQSAEARAFLASMPTVEQLMPMLNIAELEAGG